jgi:hypothetical protein
VSQLQTLEVLELTDRNTALHFHLQARCFPPADSMYDECRRAINATNKGKPLQAVRLGEGKSWRGNKSAPAWAIVRNFRLEAFINPNEDGDVIIPG